MFIKNKKTMISVVFLCIIVLFFMYFFPTSSDVLSIHIIDVGQGDSILIVTPNQNTILIDAGEPNQGPNVVSYIKNLQIDTIDILIATHPHSDHIGGIPEVINNFEINDFYMTEKSHTTEVFEDVLVSLAEYNLKINPPIINAPILVDDDLKLYFLGPLRNYGDDLNLWSIVCKVVYKNNTFLFAGDIESLAEMDIINYYPPSFLESHFLKVAHHGSSTSSTSEFLDTVKVDIFAISCGTNNPYGHPDANVLKRLKKYNASIYRTDKQGNLVFYSDGHEIWSKKKPYYLPTNK
ncbi:MBL fold metallo-hydrolase [Serpentinicella sp. ANB-PHB4]|uniref:ComEC/Rec2 family competence protein n=1 Tax=Serpentinicella sp. ANB-PHB4 TaxID=3074076 RepID=UPI00285AA85C|nr:MBL fold metallo-hydrolase [Serpentinicella sp. ANB-PHB4]MDR5657956.1 MBL fold metallo-hydrolase [Serpentinicella sp. ANB-PHB4]